MGEEKGRQLWDKDSSPRRLRIKNESAVRRTEGLNFMEKISSQNNIIRNANGG